MKKALVVGTYLGGQYPWSRKQEFEAFTKAYGAGFEVAVEFDDAEDVLVLTQTPVPEGALDGYEGYEGLLQGLRAAGYELEDLEDWVAR